MRYAIFSDVHANLRAWERVLSDICAQQVDVLICLGDAVGYGPKPEEVLRGIRSATDNFVMGNHDAAAAGAMDYSFFNDHARHSMDWTSRALSAESREFLGAVPLAIDAGEILFVHAEISEPGRFAYIDEPETALANFADSSYFVTFVGHTHHPNIFQLDANGSLSEFPDQSQQLDPSCRYIVNVGSVGEPRNPEDLRGVYVIYDSETREVDFRRVAFDIDLYRSDFEATSLEVKPFFLQCHDHQTTASTSAAPSAALALAIEVPAVASSIISQKRGAVQLLFPNEPLSLRNPGGVHKASEASSRASAKRAIAFTFTLISILTISLIIWGVSYFNLSKEPDLLANLDDTSTIISDRDPPKPEPIPDRPGVHYAISAVDSVTAATTGTVGDPRTIMLDTITVGATVYDTDDLVTGISSGVAGDGTITDMDNFGVNLHFSPSSPAIWDTLFAGSDLSGAEFFILEAAGNDALSVKPIFTDDTTGNSLTLSTGTGSNWGTTGVVITEGSRDGSTVFGLTFSYVDLLNGSGGNLTTEVIKGLEFTGLGIDPVSISAALANTAPTITETVANQELKPNLPEPEQNPTPTKPNPKPVPDRDDVAINVTTVTWQAPTSVYTLGDATVITDGKLVEAVSYGSDEANHLVNGVTFIFGGTKPRGFVDDSGGAVFTGAASEYDTFTPGTLSAEIQGLLDGVARNTKGPTTATFALDGLTIGKNYLAQFFIGDNRAPNGGDSNGTVGRWSQANFSITSDGAESDQAFVMPIASFVATWEATAITQSFTIASNTTDGPTLNAVQWRDVTNAAPVAIASATPKRDPIIAWWRMEPNSVGPELVDSKNKRSLPVLVPGKKIGGIAPPAIPSNGVANTAAMSHGVWAESSPSGEFALRADRSFTFEGWFLIAPALNPIFIAGTRSGDAHDNQGWHIDIRPNGQMCFFYDNGPEILQALSKKLPVADLKPHHFAAIWDHDASVGVGEMRLYLEGEKVATAEVPHAGIPATQANPFRIGAPENPPKVGLDEVRFSRGTLEVSGFLRVEEQSSTFQIAQPEPVTIEGEDLKAPAPPSGEVGAQGMGEFRDESWSGDAHLIWTGGKKDESIDLEFTVVEGGEQELFVVLTKAGDYGIVQLSLDRKKVGEPIDCYDGKVTTTGEISLGTHNLDPGKHTLRATLVGTNPNTRAVEAGTYVFGMDYLRLTKPSPKTKIVSPKSKSSFSWWRMEPDSIGPELVDAKNKRSLPVLIPGKQLGSIAPTKIPSNGVTNTAALSIGVWAEPTPSGEFGLSADRSFTLEGWVLTKPPRGPIFLAGTRTGDANEKQGWHIDIRPKGHMCFFYDNGPTIFQALTEKELPVADLKPHHFAAVWDHDTSATAGEMRLYFEGEQVAATLVPHAQIPQTQANPFRIGAPTNPPKIGLDEVRFSISALSPLEFLTANAAPTITITDDVELPLAWVGDDYGQFFAPPVLASGTAGVTSQAGTHHAQAGTGNLATRSGGTTWATGFGPDHLIQAGTYAFTISVGDTTDDRNGFTTFAHRLETTDGETVLPNGVVTTPFVPLSNNQIAEWTTTTITYTVPAGHALIGEEFTWAASYSNTLSGTKTSGVFDAVSIEFTPAP